MDPYADGGHGIPMTNEHEFTRFHETLLEWHDRFLKVPVAIVP